MNRTGKQLFSSFMMAIFALAMAVLLVRMIVCGDYRLWAVELALLCGFAVMLRTYAFEWRKQRDDNQRQDE